MARLYTRMPRPWYLLALAVAAAVPIIVRSIAPPAAPLSGPSPQDSTVLASARQQLAAAELRWNLRGPTNYKLRVRVTCFCPPRPILRVSVRGGVTTAALDSAASPGNEQATSPSPYTVPALFAEIRQLQVDTNWAVEATYDSVLGYPLTVSTSHRRITDIGHGIQVLSLDPIPQ